MKLCILFLMSFLCVSTTCFAEASLSLIPDICIHNNDIIELDIDSQVKEKYLAAAKFLAKSSKSSSKTVQTNIITYETTSFGVNCHIGWYTDGYIGTSLDGTEQGKQFVFLNGAVVGISYDIERKGDHFVHKYTWGKVYSYPNSQVVQFN